MRSQRLPRLNYAQRIEKSAIVPKICYGQIIKGLEKLRADNERDIQENPTATRIGYKGSIRMLIEGVMRQNRVSCPHNIPDLVMEYLCKKGIIVPYCGDYSFPGTDLPSREEIVEKTNKMIDGMFGTAKPVN